MPASARSVACLPRRSCRSVGLGRRGVQTGVLLDEAPGLGVELAGDDDAGHDVEIEGIAVLGGIVRRTRPCGVSTDTRPPSIASTIVMSTVRTSAFGSGAGSGGGRGFGRSPTIRTVATRSP